MRIFIYILTLLGLSVAVAAVTPVPTPPTDEVVLDVDSLDLEEDDFVLTQEDEEFLNSEEPSFAAGIPLLKGQQEANAAVKTAPAPKE